MPSRTVERSRGAPRLDEVACGRERWRYPTWVLVAIACSIPTWVFAVDCSIPTRSSRSLARYPRGRVPIARSMRRWIARWAG